ncbi:hypothetical protein [Cryptosporangium minutisporangium]|uniref:hypothetical protein n=1 Tax=Cryptosporangium minutisporangium TaxID=113569 RepID=UPI0031E56A46
MISECPECGAAGVPLLFGLPGPEAMAAAAEGQVALGGCVLPERPADWQCSQWHRWSEPDQRAWEERLLAVLSAHGYREADDRLP